MIGLLRQLLAAILSFLLVAPTFSYARNRLTNLAVNNSTASIESYAYTLDAAGHLLSVSELSGRTVNYGYDNLYRLTSETIASDPHSINGAVSYTYDSVGQSQANHFDARARSRGSLELQCQRPIHRRGLLRC